MTDPGEMASLFDSLPAAVPDLCRALQGLLIPPLLTELYGVDLTSTQKKEVNIRPVSDMLRRIQRYDPRPLSEPRPAAERLAGGGRRSEERRVGKEWRSR